MENMKETVANVINNLGLTIKRTKYTESTKCEMKLANGDCFTEEVPAEYNVYLNESESEISEEAENFLECLEADSYDKFNVEINFIY